MLFIDIFASNSPVINYFRYEKHKPHPEGHWPKKPLLTEEDLMQIFGVSKSSIRRWRLNNVIPFFKLGGTYFTSLEYLREILMEKIDESFKKFHDHQKREQSKQNANDTK